MWDNFVFTVTEYVKFYGDYGQQLWRGMTPLQYGGLLIGVAFFGWLLMKSGTKSI